MGSMHTSNIQPSISQKELVAFQKVELPDLQFKNGKKAPQSRNSNVTFQNQVHKFSVDIAGSFD